MLKKIIRRKSGALNKKLLHVWTNPLHFVAFGFGSGLSPVMPGTCGTIVAIPIYLLMTRLSLLWYLLVFAVLTLFGVWGCGKVSRDIKYHDYPGIVWDEVVGFLMTMIAIPVCWWTILLGFVLFRVFDIWKPWPIHWLDKNVQGGWGVILDDLMAALYAWAILQAVILYV